MNAPNRYHPLLVTLHWLTAALMLGAGLLSEEDAGRSPVKIHMVLGALLLIVMLFRVIVRFRTRHPAKADAGHELLNKLGVLVHFGLYLAVFYILGMGALIAYNRNMFAYLMGSATTLNRTGSIAIFHQMGWLLAVVLVFAHAGAALYHQFILKDNLLARMWYGK